MSKFYDRSIATFNDNSKKLTLTALAIPKFFELISGNVVSTINTAVLSGYSKEYVSAINVSQQLLNIIIILFSILTTGAITLISIELGRGNKEKAAEYSGVMLVSMGVIFLIAGLAGAYFAEPLTKLMNVKEELLALSVEYVRIRMSLLFFDAVRSGIICLLICNGYAIFSFLTVLISSALSAFFTYVVLYANWNTHFSKMELVALVNELAVIISLIFVIVVFIACKCPFKLCCKFNLLKKLALIGTPGAAGGFFYSVSQTITTSMIAFMGITVIQEKVYYGTITGYVFCLGYALGYGVSILIGRYKGHENYEAIDKLYSQTVKLTVIINFLISGLVYLLREKLLLIFTNDKEIIALSGIVFLIDILVEIPRAVNNVADNALRAVGDVKTPFFVATTACFGLTVFFTYLLGIKLKMGIIGCWTAFAIDEIFKAACYLIIWKKGKWKEIKI